MDENLSRITPEMEELALLASSQALEEIQESGQLVPFVITVPMSGDEMTVTPLPDLEPDDLLAAFKETVRHQNNQARLYAVTYDGYLRANGTEIDAVVVEFGQNTDDFAHAIGIPYEGDGDDFKYEEQATYLGDCPTYFFTGIE